MDNQLKPCPFCGEEARVENTTFGDSYDEHYRVNCKNGHTLDWWETDINEAVKVWNTRALQPSNSESAKCQSDCRFASDMLHCGYCIRDDETLEEYKNYNDFYESE